MSTTSGAAARKRTGSSRLSAVARGPNGVATAGAVVDSDADVEDEDDGDEDDACDADEDEDEVGGREDPATAAVESANKSENTLTGPTEAAAATVDSLEAVNDDDGKDDDDNAEAAMALSSDDFPAASTVTFASDEDAEGDVEDCDELADAGGMATSAACFVISRTCWSRTKSCARCSSVFSCIRFFCSSRSL